MTTPGLVWTGEMDGTFGAYDAKTLEQKWSINVGGTFSAPPIAFKVGDKEYIAIAAGGSAVTTFGYPELANRPAANVLYVFAL
jgi:alcohol dehydrogenase (cytochrome c)